MAVSNRETDAAWLFHRATSYVLVPDAPGDDDLLVGIPPHLVRAVGEQDPVLEPLPYKIYTSLPPIPLPGDLPDSPTPALDAIAATGDLPAADAVPDLAALARLCLRSNGLLKRWRNASGREWEFRAADCTGARYHIELYLVCGQLPDLEAGVYHYAAHDHTLRLLRRGDHRALLVAATGEEPAVAEAPVVAVCTSTFWRNAWRYQGRAYRHVYWDTGTLLANLLAVAAAAGLPAKVALGYVDREVNALLDVDGEREAAVALVALGRTAAAPPPAPAIGPLGLPTQALSPREIVFPEIGALHRASSLGSAAEARAWRARPLHRAPTPPNGESIALRPLAADEIPHESIDEVIRRRRSNRHYQAETPLPFALFSTVVDRALGATAIDALDPAAPSLHDVYLIVNNVADLAPGAYVVDRERRALALLAPGDFRAVAADLACAQDYAADAHVDAYALTELGPVLERYGNRGYRLAQLEAALFAGKLQLAAHALGLGAVGSTAVDDAVTAFFSPRAAGASFMFVAVFGQRRRPSGAETAASTGLLRGAA